jgi:hypothetical protein
MTRVVIPRARSRAGSRSRRLALALGATAVVTVALLAAAATASANDVTCTGFTRLDKTVPSDNKVAYRFRCTDAIAGYTIFSVDEIASFEPEGVVQDPMTFQGLNNESYSCEGVLPSHGEVCNGKAGGGHVVTSSVDTDKLPCSSTSNFYLSVADAKGAPAGLFTLGRPRGCPRAVRARRQSHRAVRRTRH